MTKRRMTKEEAEAVIRLELEAFDHKPTVRTTVGLNGDGLHLYVRSSPLPTVEVTLTAEFPSKTMVLERPDVTVTVGSCRWSSDEAQVASNVLRAMAILSNFLVVYFKNNVIE